MVENAPPVVRQTAFRLVNLVHPDTGHGMPMGHVYMFWAESKDSRAPNPTYFFRSMSDVRLLFSFCSDNLPAYTYLQE